MRNAFFDASFRLSGKGISAWKELIGKTNNTILQIKLHKIQTDFKTWQRKIYVIQYYACRDAVYIGCFKHTYIMCITTCIIIFLCGSVGMADEQDSGSCVGHHVWVQVPSSALLILFYRLWIRRIQGFFRCRTVDRELKRSVRKKQAALANRSTMKYYYTIHT